MRNSANAVAAKYATMNYNELMEAFNKQMEEMHSIQMQMESKKKEAITDAMRTFVETMNSYGVSKTDAFSGLSKGNFLWSSQDMTTTAIPEPVSITTATEIVENKKEEEITPEVSMTGSVFDNPAFKAPYHPVSCRKEQSAAPVETAPMTKSAPISITEEKIVPLSSLLSDETKASEHSSKNRKKHLTMNQLLSGEPINQIILMGNESPKGAAYRQHTRLSHVDGIIPTETACGHTDIYIPEQI